MGRQIEFIMDREMEDRFWDFLLSVNELKLLFKSDEGVVEINKLPEYGIGFCLTIYLYIEQLGELKLSENDYVKTRYSPVIEFRRSFNNHKEKRIGRGRLYVQLDYWDENDVLIKKDEELKKMYDKLARWIRKNIPRVEVNYGYAIYKEHVTQEVKRLIEEEKYNRPLNPDFLKNQEKKES